MTLCYYVVVLKLRIELNKGDCKVKYYDITLNELKDLIKSKACKGIRVIVDEQHLTFKTAKTAVKELCCIIGIPSIYRNMNDELTFNFDSKGERQ